MVHVQKGWRDAVAIGMLVWSAFCACAAEDGVTLPFQPPPAPAIAPATPVAVPSGIDVGLAMAQASAEVRYLGGWIQSHRDHAGQPFVIVDKKDARIYVFDDRQALVGSSAVLVGSAIGDSSAPGVGRRAQLARVAPAERTTPAGRFASEPGRNLAGEDIVWFDYDAALAIHRLRPDAARERRAQGLATPTPEDNRMSLGCVVVPVAFYEQVVRPWLGRLRGTVYVLPETRAVQVLWPAEAPVLARSD